MASSSRISRTKYDVFISFRGEDVRSNFLSHLTKELKEKKINVYVDDRVKRGDEIWQSLVDAIEHSLFSLIIFSKDYASSKWCLKELLKIMECKNTHGHIVIPIFYHIEPTHVRHQTESYEKAFAEHHKNYKEEKVQSWRSAMTKAANLSGFPTSKYKDEAELVEQVVKFLSTNLNHMYSRDSRNNLVGIDEKVTELKTLMRQGSQNVTLIGIWGMGGNGKTTIATEVYRRFHYDYEGYYFQANVREEFQKQGIVQLKKQIFKRLLNEKDLDIDTPYGMPSHVERKLGRTKILLVLDDINDSNQLECLVGEPDLFGPGSIIIVTTRDREVLNGKVVNHNIYEVKPLKFAESLKLFNLNVSIGNCLDLEWIELSKRVIEYAKGLPLALKVLGSFLRGKSKQEWNSQMKKLERTPNQTIHHVLRLSYDSLDRDQKAVFLYIACYFKGYKRREMITLLDACGFSTIIELTVLQNKALITWSDEEPHILMHDLIEEMGKEIVREESMGDLGKRRHLWNFEDVYTVLQNNMGTALIESINCSGNLSLNPQVFARMHNLKFLKSSKEHLLEGLEYLPNELRVLDWKCYPLKSLPSKFCAKNLVQLIMSESKLKKLWDGVMPLGNLKKIDLSWCTNLMEFPDISTAKNLEKLVLCWSNLKKLWDGVMPLGNLKKIDLTQCKYLMKLPDLSTARNLKALNLDHCKTLCRLHPSILSLPKLDNLILSGCEKLSLGSIVHFKSLRRLRLDENKGLEEFSVTSENNMIELNLSLTAIKELQLSFASQRKLEYLYLYRCESLTHLPNNFVDLKSLIMLNVSGCKKLKYLPMLPPSIQRVNAKDCRSLKTVQLDSIHRNMTHLNFENCMELDEGSWNSVELTSRHNLRNFAFKSPEELQLQSPIPNDRWNILDYGRKTRVIYPGSEVPKWFKYRTSQGSITMTIDPHFKLLGFIFCMILRRGYNFMVDCLLENSDGEMVPLGNENLYIAHEVHPIISIYDSDLVCDHVCLCYEECSGLMNERVEERKGNDQNNLKLSFEFFRYIDDVKKKKVIKKCGMYPIYEEEGKEEDEDSEEKDEVELEAFRSIKRLEEGKEEEEDSEEKDEVELEAFLFNKEIEATSKLN